MQNMLQLQDDLKNFSEQQLVREMQMPSGQVPQFLILTELGRRKRIKDDFTRQQAANAPTVAEEAVAAAGMPVGEATGIAKSMAPKTSMAENTGIGTMMPRQPTRMADGGVVKMQAGGLPEYARKDTLLGVIKRKIGEGKWSKERDLYVSALGEDAVREAESAILPTGPLNSYENSIALQRMEKQGIFGNSPGRPQLTPEKPTFLPPPESTRQRGDLETRQLTSILASDPITQALAQKSGVSVADYISGMDPDTRVQELLRVSGQRATTFDKDKDDTAYASFVDTPSNYNIDSQIPTQEDLDLKEVSDTRNEAVGIGTSDNPISVDLTKDVAPTVPSSAGLPARLTSPTAPTFDISGSPDNLSAVGGLETIQSAPEAFTMETAAANLASMVGPDDAIEQVRASQVTNADRFDTLGFTPITAEDGSKRFISPAGMVYDSDGKLISGGEAMQTIDVAQQQGTDFSKSPLGTLPIGSYDTDELGNVIPGTFEPTSIPIGGVSTPSIIEDNIGAPLISLLGVEEGSAPVTSVDESGVRVSPATPAENVVGETKKTDIPTSKPAPATTPELTFGTGTAGAGDLPLSLGDTATRDIGDPNKTVKINDRTISPTTTDTSTGTSISTGGVGGMGGIEGQLADMLKDMDKARDQDKWLALASTGLKLMASKQPTLGGAIGEAGMTGIKQLREGKKAYSKDKMAILALQQRIDAAKLAASSRASASNAALARLGLSIDKENRLASQAEMDRTLDKLNTLGGVDRIRVLQNADDLSPSEAQELLMLQGLYNTVFGGSTGAKAVNVAG